jgi:hypothetical protein
VSPAKPTQDALSVELPVELSYREAASEPSRRPHHSLMDLMGDDPFFQRGNDLFAEMESMFDEDPLRRRDVTLRATADKLAVEDLPTQNRPSVFSGAVGHFQVALEPLTSAPRVGEPLELVAKVTGSGNFDRVTLHGIDESPAVKTYGMRSNASTGPSKTFTQTVVPTHAGPLTLPPLTVDYFDPKLGSYETASTRSLSLDVLPAPSSGVPTPTVTSSTLDESHPVRDLPESTTTFSSLEPFYRQPRFAFLGGAMALVTSLLGAIGFARRSQRFHERVASFHFDRAVAQDLKRMETAAATRDRVGFFNAARVALQARLAALWGISPDAVTAADVSARMGERGERIRAVLEQADRVTYGSSLPNDTPLDTWDTIVRAELEHLHNVRPSMPLENLQ